MIPIDKFNANILSIKNYSQLHSYICQNIPLIDDCEILRMQLSLAVSALDKYIHDKLISYFTNKIRSNDSFDNNFIKFTVTEILEISFENDSNARKQLLLNRIINKINKLTFQSPDLIKQAATAMKITNFWNRLASIMEIDSDVLQGKLKLIVQRRNQIVHESDFDEIAMNKRAISENDVQISIVFIETFISAFDILSAEPNTAST